MEGFPSSPVVKNLHANAGFDPWSGKIPSAMGRLSPCAATGDPAHWSLCSASGEATTVSPSTATRAKSTCSDEEPVQQPEQIRRKIC